MWLGKRLFDFFAALFGLIILSPIFIVISLWIKISSKGPVFFRQERVGLNRKNFRIHKFRTMYTDAERRGPLITVGSDSRVTPIGLVLRKYKIDELPQLIDVLLGDMSLVGPRPEVPKYVDKFSDEMKEKIFKMKPGITDWASINYKDESHILSRAEDPEKAYIEEVLPKKLSFAVTYLDRASLFEDLKIIFLTFFEMVYKREEKWSFLGFVVNLRRRYKIVLMLLTDSIILPLALYTAIILREGTMDIDVEQYYGVLLAVPLIMIPIFIKLGLYRAVIRYMDVKLIQTIAYGSTLGTLLLIVFVAMARVNALPRTSLAIFWVFSVAYVGASRLFVRGLLLGFEESATTKKRVAIYGAGTAGAQMAYALSRSNEYLPVLFVDDDAESKNTSVIGLRVYSPKKLDSLIDKYAIDEILLAMPSVPRSRIKSIIESLETLGIAIKILPAISDVLSGKVRVEQIREVQIEDLLGRDQVHPREELLHKCILDKNVCVTGAGGSIGSELCRQVLAIRPKKIVIIDQSEFGLYEIEKELRSLESESEIVPILMDVTDEEKMFRALEKHKIQTVYHASAYKHVPIVELNPSVGVVNNAFGTLAAAHAAIRANVDHFILISTDKAVRPTNVMGASKRLAELILQSLTPNSKTIFSMVRFGNVLGSSGSVVPLFRQQIKKGGPVTITHREITRFFMSIPEAAQLVIQAGSMAKGGEVFLLDMGESIRIYDLAKRMIELSGLTVRDQENPTGDIAIEVTGLRPGEKLYEELLISGDVLDTGHPRILKSNEDFIEWKDLKGLLENLKTLCDQDLSTEIKYKLKEIVKEYSPQFE